MIYPSKLKVFTKYSIQLNNTAAEALQDLISNSLIKSDGSGQQVQVSSSDQEDSSAAGWSVQSSKTQGKNRDTRDKVETFLRALEMK